MAPRSTHVVRLGDERFSVEIGDEGDVRVAGVDGSWRVTREPDGSYLASQGELRRRVMIASAGDRIHAFADGEFYDLHVEREGRARRTAGRTHVESLTVPMPARVVKVLVTEGQAVKRGDVLVTLEAMKMELPLKAPRDASVRSIASRVGDLVQPGTAVLELT
jgi:biotin carboxyl carrier protein